VQMTNMAKSMGAGGGAPSGGGMPAGGGQPSPEQAAEMMKNMTPGARSDDPAPRATVHAHGVCLDGCLSRRA
jgi:hypothetical protein